MKIVVIGANGATGRLAVFEGLARGHEMVAFVRDEAQVTLTDPHLTVAQGDALDQAAVVAALEGADAVISAIGRTRKKGSKQRDKGSFYAPAIRVILTGMAEREVTRLAVISSQGVGDEQLEGLSLPLRAFRLVVGRVMKDMREMERLIEASDTEWTITRPGGLTGKPKGEYVVQPGNSLRGHGSTPRADLAEALVLAVTEGRWPRQAVIVAA
jgi:putative NADH-flavin reductase